MEVRKGEVFDVLCRIQPSTLDSVKGFTIPSCDRDSDVNEKGSHFLTCVEVQVERSNVKGIVDLPNDKMLPPLQKLLDVWKSPIQEALDQIESSTATIDATILKVEARQRTV